MNMQSPYQTFKRYRTLQTDVITSLPIVILMPHSACNCRCVMCDIWKGNKDLKQLTESDIIGLLPALKKYETRQVLMTGGEALLNPNFFRFCEILKKENIRITLLSTGLTIARNAEFLVRWVDDIIISLDGDQELHDEIRNIPGAFNKLKEGIDALRAIDPSYPVSGRSVIQQLNFKKWPAIIEAAELLHLNTISFLPADISSEAFNRPIEWPSEKKQQIIPAEDQLKELYEITEYICMHFRDRLKDRFISESADKLRKISQYYAACYGLAEFPYKTCNAPWVSTVIEADGTVRPCFFHRGLGNIKEMPLEKILNDSQAIQFRKNLDTNRDSICKKCVCYLNLKPGANI